MVDLVSKEQAVAFAERGLWRELDANERVHLSCVVTDRLCMPFPELHQAIEAVDGGPVFTHELASKDRVRDLGRKTEMTGRLRDALAKVGVSVPE